VNDAKNQVRSGADFHRDKQNGFKDRSTNTSLHRNLVDEKLKLECLRIASEGLARINIPNIADHGEKVIALSKQYEKYVKSGES
jgi:predicted  nucleic acid-binding Zn-ribbon protein